MHSSQPSISRYEEALKGSGFQMCNWVQVGVTVGEARIGSLPVGAPTFFLWNLADHHAQLTYGLSIDTAVHLRLSTDSEQEMDYRKLRGLKYQ
jgi:hypothetical protein